MSALEAFHFLRPGWLLLFAPAGLIVASILLAQDPMRSWRAVISPRLLEHLAVREAQRRGRIRPAVLLAALWLVGIVALAGPSWEREAAPFTADRSALFIVLKVTPSMLAEDIQPSRLQRAAQKIGDLLERRGGARNGLIAYAGSAHLVMPLTSDPDVVGYFAAELDPEVMPVAGDQTAEAVALARQRLRDSGLAGSVVLIADHVDPAETGALATARQPGDADVHVLAVAAGPEVVPPPGSPPAAALDEAAMRAAARAAGGALFTVTPDDADVRGLAARIERSLESAPAQDGERWKDGGYGLLLLFFLLALIFFRPGGAVAVQR